MLEDDEGQPERKLKEVLEQLLASCNEYLDTARTAFAGSTAGKTRLDKERLKLCAREIVSGTQRLFIEYDNTLNYIYIK